MIYGEKYSFLSLFTKALPADRRMDRWTDGRTDGRTDTASYRDARTHQKSVNDRKLPKENHRHVLTNFLVECTRLYKSHRQL